MSTATAQTSDVGCGCGVPKRLLVAVPQSWADPAVHEITLWPGMTAREVLTNLGLPERLLVQLGREVVVIPPNTQLCACPCVFDGIRLFAL